MEDFVMETLKDYAGVLSHHVKLVTDSGISPAALHAIHSSGLFSTLLLCEKPHMVNREELADLLKVQEQRNVKKLCGLAERKLEQAAKAREQNRFLGSNSWFEHIHTTGELLRAIYRQVEKERFDQRAITSMADTPWQPLNDRYYAEASAMLLFTAYGRACELKDAQNALLEAMKSDVPCHVCSWTGHCDPLLDCGACGGRKLLPVRVITCPECSGSCVGCAYAGTDGSGVCPRCFDRGAGAGNIYVDSLNKQVLFDPGIILKIPHTS